MKRVCLTLLSVFAFISVSYAEIEVELIAAPGSAWGQWGGAFYINQDCHTG